MELNKEKVNRIIFGIGVNSYNRFITFMANLKGLTDAEYWYGLGLAYTSSDNLSQWRHLGKSAFSSKRPKREHLMNGEERKKFAALPERLRIYRGMTEEEYKSGVFGISWTLSEKVAKFFAEKYLRNHATNRLPKTVHSIQVNKSDAIAFFNGREEDEIIYIKSCERERFKMPPERIIRGHLKRLNQNLADFEAILWAKASKSH